MLTLQRMDRIHVRAQPWSHKFVGGCYLAPNFEVLPGVDIVFENFDQVPSAPVMFAMNHTDRFNYWPFQYKLWRTSGRLTATWAKAKYLEHPFLAAMITWTGNIPAPSLGYIISKDLMKLYDRKPTDDEFNLVKSAYDQGVNSKAPSAARERARKILGYDFDPQKETYIEALSTVYHKFFKRFLEINAEVLAQKGDILVFPQGTRSVRLSKGRTGLAQVALANHATIVPVGCSGSDLIYPGNIPWAKKGRVVYRFGKPIVPASMKQYKVEPEKLQTPQPDQQTRTVLQTLTDRIMNGINDLVDEPYKFDPTGESDGVKGVSRFI